MMYNVDTKNKDGKTMKNEFLSKKPNLVQLVLDYFAKNDEISISVFQRKFHIGFAIAAQLLDALIEIGVVEETPTSGIPTRRLIRENLNNLEEYAQ